jgi:transcriptional regulator with GAF, ATPase, and Fis domain
LSISDSNLRYRVKGETNVTDTRETLLLRTLVTLADSLVADYDIVELLHTLVDQTNDLFDTAASGICMGPTGQQPEVIVSTSEECDTLQRAQARVGEGPCIEALATGRVVSVENRPEMAERWPKFAAAAEAFPFSSVHAIPMRLRGETIGSLNLFRDHEGALNRDDAIAVQALADVATISVLQQRAIRDGTVVRDQLQKALVSRAIIEQAKGVLSQTHRLDMEAAFRLLRHHSRRTQTPISVVAAGVVDGSTIIVLTQPPVG